MKRPFLKNIKLLLIIIGSVSFSSCNEPLKDQVISSISGTCYECQNELYESLLLTAPGHNTFISEKNNSLTLPIMGYCHDSSATYDIQVDGVSVAGQTGVICDGAYLSGTIDTTGLAEGTMSFAVEATDEATGEVYSSPINWVTKDTISPLINVVHAPVNGNYIAGDVLEFMTDFDESVFIAGTPRLALIIGTTTVYADYISGSGSTGLLFQYAVDALDSDLDGIDVSGLDLNGASITDNAGNGALLSFPPPDTSGIFVDGSPQFQWQLTLGGAAIFTHDFGSSNTIVDKTFYIKNIGTAASSTSISAATTGTVFSVLMDDCAGKTIAIGAECAVTIRYSPTGVAGATHSGEAAIQDPTFVVSEPLPLTASE